VNNENVTVYLYTGAVFAAAIAVGVVTHSCWAALGVAAVGMAYWLKP